MTIVSIGGGKSLESNAAASFARILVVRPGMLARVNSAYRSDAEQAALRHAWEVDHSKPYASKPGASKHNQGLALDIDASPANADHQWMVDHGREYGWVRPDGWQKASVPEPWHFEYRPELDQHKGEDDMPTAREIALAVLGFKSPSDPNGGGNEDVYLHIRKGRFAAEAAVEAVKALGKAPAPVIDYAKLAAAMPKPEPIDYAKLAKAVNDDLHNRTKE